MPFSKENKTKKKKQKQKKKQQPKQGLINATLLIIENFTENVNL